MILALDIDGVLHPAVNYNPELLLLNLPSLEDVLRQRPSVEIVVSSTWRETRALSELQALFSHDIAARIVGVTPNWRDIQDETSFGTYVRQAEIEAWLRTTDRAWEQWIAVDDQPHLFKPFCANLFATDGATGLTAADCELLSKRLRNS